MRSKQTLVLNFRQIGCRNRCIFCLNPVSLSGKYLSNQAMDRVAREELAKLRILKKKDIGSIIISGNDPVEYHDLAGFLKKLKEKTKIGILLQSHCIDFKDFELTKKILEIGNIECVQVPLYGPTAAVHDRITGNRGSFKAVLKAIDNFERLGFGSIRWQTLFLRQNQRILEKLFGFLFKTGYPISASLPSIPSLNGQHFKRAMDCVPDLALVKNFLSKIKNKSGAERLFLYDIPFCLSSGAGKLSFRDNHSYGAYKRLDKKADMVLENNEQIPAYRVLVKTDRCRSCSFDKACKGIKQFYLEKGLFSPAPIKERIYL